MEEQTVSHSNKWNEPRYILAALGMVIFGIIVVVSIVREKIVDSSSNQVSVTGQGRVSYQPDVAKIT
ncbi:MAG: hypothetical protein ACD_5C00332G0003, partial [uncultured bacterium]